MRYLTKRILILILCGMTFSCATSVVLRDHRDLILPSQCPYTKMSVEAKASLNDKAITEIFENKKACTARAAKITELVETHNKAYSK